MAAQLEVLEDAPIEVTPGQADILDLNRVELAAALFDRFGFEAFRSRQLISWLYKRRVRDFSEMTDISRGARETLQANYSISRLALSTVQQSKDGTRKYLFALADGMKVESVLIKQPTRYTLCISSQVGCAIGCAFCRTGRMGLIRHLRSSEIIGQVLAVQDDLHSLRKEHGEDAAPESFQNNVFMGMGEPFHNLDNVIRAVTLLNDPLGLHFSARKITVSTSGLVPAIEKFGVSEAKANLAISLNATTDAVRDVLIPINKKWPIAKLLETLRAYPLKKGRRITIEYVMLSGVNDYAEYLRRLPQLLRGIPSKVNLIPYNDNTGLGFRSSSRDVVQRWQETLLDAGLNSTIRWSKGIDIDAACGQLATNSERQKRSRS